MEVLVGADRVMKVREDALPDLRLNAATHQQQAGPGSAGGDQKHGEQKLGPHPKFHHAHLSPSPNTSQSWELTHKLVTHAMNSPEMYRIGRVFLQLLPKLQNMIVHRAGGWIILVTPYLIQ